MKDYDIPVKTSRGVAEIKTRQLGLVARLRTILLLVDGARTVQELERLIQASGAEPDTLESLMEKGLIELPAPEAEPAGALPDEELEEFAGEEVTGEAPLKDSPVADLPIADWPEISVPPPANPVFPTTVPSPAAGSAPAQEESRHQAATQATPEGDTQDPAETAFLVARAHLASALDDHLGFKGYPLKQKVMDCESVQDLISHFDEVEENLVATLGIADATSIIRRAITILQMH
jgi:hypothetical protein